MFGFGFTIFFFFFGLQLNSCFVICDALPNGRSCIISTETHACGKSSIQGHRVSQEDQILCFKVTARNMKNGNALSPISQGFDIFIISVFDGHGGSEASEFASSEFKEIFVKEVSSLCDEITREDFKSRLKRLLHNSILDIDRKFTQIFSGSSSAGSTACIAAIVYPITNSISNSNSSLQYLNSHYQKTSKETLLFTANLGDSKAFLCVKNELKTKLKPSDGKIVNEEDSRQRKTTFLNRVNARSKKASEFEFKSKTFSAIDLTLDHSPCNINESQRIKSLGGFVTRSGQVCRVNGQLAVSRAIGDFDFRPFVISEPDIADSSPLFDDSAYLFVVSDGVLEKLTPQDVCDALDDIIQGSVEPDVLRRFDRRSIIALPPVKETNPNSRVQRSLELKLESNSISHSFKSKLPQDRKGKNNKELNEYDLKGRSRTEDREPARSESKNEDLSSQTFDLKKSSISGYSSKFQLNDLAQKISQIAFFSGSLDNIAVAVFNYHMIKYQDTILSCGNFIDCSEGQSSSRQREINYMDSERGERSKNHICRPLYEVEWKEMEENSWKVKESQVQKEPLVNSKKVVESVGLLKPSFLGKNDLNLEYEKSNENNELNGITTLPLIPLSFPDSNHDSSPSDYIAGKRVKYTSNCDFTQLIGTENLGHCYKLLRILPKKEIYFMDKHCTFLSFPSLSEKKRPKIDREFMHSKSEMQFIADKQLRSSFILSNDQSEHSIQNLLQIQQSPKEIEQEFANYLDQKDSLYSEKWDEMEHKNIQSLPSSPLPSSKSIPPTSSQLVLTKSSFIDAFHKELVCPNHFFEKCFLPLEEKRVSIIQNFTDILSQYLTLIYTIPLETPDITHSDGISNKDSPPLFSTNGSTNNQTSSLQNSSHERHKTYILRNNFAKGAFGEVWLAKRTEISCEKVHKNNCGLIHIESDQAFNQIEQKDVDGDKFKSVNNDTKRNASSDYESCSPYINESKISESTTNAFEESKLNMDCVEERISSEKKAFVGDEEDGDFVLKRIISSSNNQKYLSGIREKYFGELFLNLSLQVNTIDEVQKVIPYSRFLNPKSEANFIQESSMASDSGESNILQHEWEAVGLIPDSRELHETDIKNGSANPSYKELGKVSNGLNHIARYIESFESENEFWLVFRNEGTSLSSLLYSSEDTSSENSEASKPVEIHESIVDVSQINEFDSENFGSKSRMKSKKFIENEDYLDVHDISPSSSRNVNEHGDEIKDGSNQEYENDKSRDMNFQVLKSSDWWEWLKTSKNGNKALKKIMYQLLLAIDFCHQHNISHRDIKPENLLLSFLSDSSPKSTQKFSTDFTMRLADFGSAVNNFSFHNFFDSNRISKDEETERYSPPEAILGTRSQIRFDIQKLKSYDMWSVGVVFLELILGTSQVWSLDARTQTRLEHRLQGWHDSARHTAYLLRVWMEMCIYLPGEMHDHHWQETHEQKIPLAPWKCTEESIINYIQRKDPLQIGIPNIWALRLLRRLLQWFPSDRISSSEALKHAYFKDIHNGDKTEDDGTNHDHGFMCTCGAEFEFFNECQHHSLVENRKLNSNDGRDSTYSRSHSHHELHECIS